MECAIVLARRGADRVHLVDEADALGGHLRWVTELPGMAEWKKIISWRESQIARLRSIEVILGRRLTAQDVLEYGANRVVIATGACWAETGTDSVTRQTIPGADASLPYVLSPEQIMLRGQRPLGNRVTVYDAEGSFMAVGLAELLALEGLEVHFATPLAVVAPYLDLRLEGDAARTRLAALGVTFAPQHALEAIVADAFTLRRAYRWSMRLESDAVLIVMQRLLSNELFSQVLAHSDKFGEAEIKGLYTIGDAVAPRLLEDAIFDGHRMGREIDGPHPSTPQPFRRNYVQPAGVTAWDKTPW
jgi:dimethylamine/trimethylamine dehydrogenase